MPFCTICGKQNPDTAKFCTGCGVTLVAKQETTVQAAFPLEKGRAKKKKPNWILIGSLGALAVAIGVYFIFFNKNKNGDESKTDVTTEQTVSSPVVDSIVAITATPQPSVSEAVPLNNGVQSGEVAISKAEVDNVSQALKKFYQCENDGDISCLLNNYNFPVNRYYQLNNVSYEDLHKLFTESFTEKLSYHFINIKWDYCTVQKDADGYYGYKAVLYADYSFTRQNTPDENRSRSIQVVIFMNSNYKITAIYENQ